jgi:molybdate transport system substrate-binding protein
MSVSNNLMTKRDNMRIISLQYLYSAALVAVALVFTSTTGHAEEIKVFSVNGVKSVMAGLGAPFEATSGNRVRFTFATIGGLQEKMAAGELPDVLIAISPAISAAEAEGKLVPGSIVEVGRTSLAIAVKEGTSMPDISTAQNFRQAVLSAKSLVYSDPKSGAASGVAIAQLLNKLGIADQVKNKTTLITSSVGEVVVQGKAELGAQQISELLPVKGIAIQPLPTELQTVTIYRAAILAQSNKRQSAAAFIRFVTGAEAARIFSEAGFGKH